MLRGQYTQVFGVYPGPIDTKMGEVLTLEKASPAAAARAIVAGIIAGNEEIFPDAMSQGTGRLLRGSEGTRAPGRRRPRRGLRSRSASPGSGEGGGGDIDEGIHPR
jgi:hypothetical protein